MLLRHRRRAADAAARAARERPCRQSCADAASTAAGDLVLVVRRWPFFFSVGDLDESLALVATLSAGAGRCFGGLGVTATAAGGFFAGDGLPTATGGGLGGGLFSSTPRVAAVVGGGFGGLGSTSATGDASFSAGLSAAPASAAATGGHRFFGGMPATSAFSGLPSTLPTAKTAAPAPRRTFSGLSPAEMNDSIATARQAQFSRRQAQCRADGGENRSGFRVRAKETV